MKNNHIPRLNLEDFSQLSMDKTTLLSVEQHDLGIPLFDIIERKTVPLKDYISPNRRAYYKIFIVMEGSGTLHVGLHRYDVIPGDIVFLHPDQVMSWQIVEGEPEGHSCMIHPTYFDEYPHLIQFFKSYPFFHPAKAVVHLSAEDAVKINARFHDILKEERSNEKDKKQMLLLHLQMIMMEVQRIGKTSTDLSVADQYRHIHDFLLLLEESFQMDNPNEVIAIKTVAEFADHLNVHPTYLNQLIKNHTGKTVREHIQERLLYEAKILLSRSDWSIQQISYILGFSEPASFTSLFKKKEQMSPSQFRKSLVH